MISIRLGYPGDFAAIQAVERSASFLFSGNHMEWAVDQVTDIADSEARLAAWLASEPAPDRRCAMIRPLC